MSMTLVKVLKDKRDTLWHGAKAVLDAAETDKRELSAEESTQFDATSAEMNKLWGQMEGLLAVEAQNKAASDAMTRALGRAGDTPPGDDGELEESFRALARKERGSVEIEATRGSVQRMVDKRDLTKSVPTAGGNLVPTTFYDQLMEFAVESSGVLQAGPTILTTTGGENIEIPIVTSYGSAALVAEAAAIPEADPAFNKRVLGAYKYGQLVQLSTELINDAAFDIEGFIARIAGRNIGLAFGADLAVGTGGAKPAGLLPSATVGVTGSNAVAGVFTADNLIDLYFSVIGPYRNSPAAAWLMKDTTLAAVRKLKDGSGRYLYEPSITIGAPDSLYGKPVYTDPNIAAVGVSTKSVAFGDISAYWVRLAGGVRFERSDEFAFNTDMVTLKCLIRGDGLLVDQTGAVKAFAGGLVA